MTISDVNFLDLSNTTGIVATGVVSFNLLLGMMISTHYRSFPVWKKYKKFTRHINVLKIHTYTAFTGVGLIVLHVIFLLMATSSGFTIWSALYPVVAPHQPFFVSLGTVSFFALIIVAFTSIKIARRTLHFKLWKRIHFTSYALVFLFLLHGIFIDQSLQGKPIDLLDGDKMVSNICFLVLLTAVSFRLRHALRRRHSKKQFAKMKKSPHGIATLLVILTMLLCTDGHAQIIVTGSYQLTLNGSVLGDLIPSTGHRLLLSYSPGLGGSFDSRTEYYTEGSYNADSPGVLLHNINEHKFEFQLMYSRPIWPNIGFTIGGLHHENFTFTDHYFWLIAGVTYSGFIIDSALSLSGGILAERKVMTGRLFYDLSGTLTLTAIKDWEIFGSIHRYENFGMTDLAPTEKLEYEFGINRIVSHNHSIGISFFRHEQFGAPNDQFSFAKFKYTVSF